MTPPPEKKVRDIYAVDHTLDLTNERLYKVLLRYCLTEEQMEENGYPTPNNLTKSLDEGKFELLERTCDG